MVLPRLTIIMKKIEKCIIVGAGIAGLLAAQRLKDYHIEPVILEKSRGYGGRMAIKHLGEGIFDCGAQFMTTREPAFRARVEKWLSKGETRPWYAGPLKNMRYVGTSGMTTVPNRIGSELNVRLSEKVVRIAFKQGVWTVITQPHNSDTELTYQSELLVLTAPVPQSLDLIRTAGIELDYDEELELEKITYLRCLTVMAQLNGPAGLPNPGAMDLNHSILRWIGDNSVKGISPVPGSVTLHSSPKFADAAWNAREQDWITAMLSAARPFLKSDVVEAIGHRWGFSEPRRIYKEKLPFRKPYFYDENLQLGMAGDGFNGPRIEAAAISGMELASAIVNPL